MNRTLLIILTAVLTSQSLIAAEYLIVSKKNAEAQTIDKDIVRDIYLGSKLFWKDGSRIQPVHLPITDKTFNHFVEEVIQMDTSQFLSYWRRKLFSGRAHPPKQIKKIEEIIKFVEDHPDSIAILPLSPKNISEHITVIELD